MIAYVRFAPFVFLLWRESFMEKELKIQILQLVVAVHFLSSNEIFGFFAEFSYQFEFQCQVNSIVATIHYVPVLVLVVID